MSSNSQQPKKQLYESEEQFILRLPQNEAKIVRQLLQTKPKRVKKFISIEIDSNMRNATVYVKRTVLKGVVMDLPTIIECNKTVDNVHLYKTADISQILICSDGDVAPPFNQENINVNSDIDNKKFRLGHGLTPPMKNCKKSRMRKTLRNREEHEDAKEIEKELLYLLRMDVEAVASKYEFIQDTNVKTPAKLTKKAAERSIFGDISDCTSDSSSKNDIMDYTH